MSRGGNQIKSRFPDKMYEYEKLTGQQRGMVALAKGIEDLPNDLW